MEKNCKRCGKVFTPKHPSREYCGPTCKQYAYFERKGMNFGSKANPVKDTEDVKGVEDERGTMEKEPVFEIPVTEEVNPLNESGVKNEALSITPVTQEKNHVALPEIKNPEKKPAPELPKQKPESSITMTMEQLEMLLKKVAKENQQEKIVVIEKQVPVMAPAKEVKDEQVKTEVTAAPQPKPEPQKNESEVNIFTKERHPNWYYSHWENVNYVNERLKSHFKKLTELTKRYVDISVVKYISEQMNSLTDSIYFKCLPANYPFTGFIKEMDGRIEKYVRYLEEEEIEKVKIKLPVETYIEMKAIIAKIGTSVPDALHSVPNAETESPRKYNSYEHRAKMREHGIIPKHG